MAYEADMVVFYDTVDKTVVVLFRGKHTLLSGPFPDRRSGIAAGEAYCSTRGWVGDRDRRANV